MARRGRTGEGHSLIGVLQHLKRLSQRSPQEVIDKLKRHEAKRRIRA